MLSGIRRANANDTRSVVWNRVETYTVDTTPRARSFLGQSKTYNFHSGFTLVQQS
jgi:hypothetical protein